MASGECGLRAVEACIHLYHTSHRCPGPRLDHIRVGRNWMDRAIILCTSRDLSLPDVAWRGVAWRGVACDVEALSNTLLIDCFLNNALREF